MDNEKLLKRIDAMLGAYNTAHDAQQQFSDATCGRVKRDPVSDALYEATYELCHHIHNVVSSVEWENVMLGLQSEVQQ